MKLFVIIINRHQVAGPACVLLCCSACFALCSVQVMLLSLLRVLLMAFSPTVGLLLWSTGCFCRVGAVLNMCSEHEGRVVSESKPASSRQGRAGSCLGVQCHSCLSLQPAG